MSTEKRQAPSGVSEIRNIVQDHFKPQIVPLSRGDKTKADVLVLPDGQDGLKALSMKPFLDEFADHPERRKGTAEHTTIDSFIEHVNRFKSEHSALFGDKVGQRLLAVLNYHDKSAEGTPRYGDHCSNYSFPISDEWKAWKEYNGIYMDQAEFAEFLEERIVDVEVPPNVEEAALDEPTERLQKLCQLLGGRFADPAQLMELSRGLKITAEERVHNANNLSSGEIQIQFTHEHRDEQGQPVRIANLFLINVPVFRDGDLYRIPVRLRYRVRNGQIKWCYLIHKSENAMNDAVTGVCERAELKTELPLFYGSPERG